MQFQYVPMQHSESFMIRCALKEVWRQTWHEPATPCSLLTRGLPCLLCRGWTLCNASGSRVLDPIQNHASLQGQPDLKQADGSSNHLMKLTSGLRRWLSSWSYLDHMTMKLIIFSQHLSMIHRKMKLQLLPWHHSQAQRTIASPKVMKHHS